VRRAHVFGRRSFDFSQQVAVMAIVNRTPDSFYDRGATFPLDAALAAVDRALAQGADWLDVGGVKAGPGEEVTEEQECRRVLPVIEAARARTSAVISVDTVRVGVAERALAAGADVINDISGLRDAGMADLAAATGAGLVVAHNPGPLRARVAAPDYGDVVTEVIAFLKERTELALDRGVSPGQLIVDPAHDLSKHTYHSLELTRRLGELTALGYPVLAALSNKDFIGETLGVGITERLEGSLAAAVVSVLNGARILRVHEVGPTVRAIRMAEAILGWREPVAARRGLPSTRPPPTMPEQEPG
jgi:dihydropteroate synthase